jgi:hypothetical protein
MDICQQEMLVPTVLNVSDYLNGLISVALRAQYEVDAKEFERM